MSMKRTFRVTRRMLGGTALICAAALLPGTAMASSAPASHAQRSHVKSSWAAPCRESQTLIWLGLSDVGAAAGTTFYPLEFTNTSHSVCSLFGYPRAWAVTQDGKQIGKSSRHLSQWHNYVNLWPGQTAHATLGIVDAGNVCSKPVTAVGLRVRAPGQWSSTIIPLSFPACHGARVLVVGPIQPGVGIPG
jgi:hypothetical protein